MFDFDFGLGDEIDMLREAVRNFARDRIAPRAEDIDASNQFPRDLGLVCIQKLLHRCLLKCRCYYLLRCLLINRHYQRQRLSRLN